MTDKTVEYSDWIKLNTDVGYVNKATNIFDKYICKPLIIAGLLTGVGSLFYGLYSFRNGNLIMSQKMMRTRVVSHGFTVSITMLAIFSLLWKKIDENPKGKRNQK